MSLLPAVCAHCRRPLGLADAAFCETHWPQLSTEARRRYVRERNRARATGKATRGLLLAVQVCRRELASLPAPLATDEG